VLTGSDPATAPLGARVTGGRGFASLRRSFPADPGSRQRTQELLALLAAGGHRPAAWGQFAVRAVGMSCEAAVERPRAAAEVTALHAVVLLVARCRGRAGGAWTGLSWLLAVTHLGLLGERRSLGAANAVTLARACLPTLADGRWTGPAALAADFLDGQLARHRGEATVFGSYADTIADAAFWTWFAARHEPSRPLRAAAAAAWTAPVAAVAAVSVARGRMTDVPRPALVRPAAPLAVLLVVRACARRRGQAPEPGRRHRPVAGAGPSRRW
jgi:CDP-alcohol phosphatidyltransferase